MIQSDDSLNQPQVVECLPDEVDPAPEQSADTCLVHQQGYGGTATSALIHASCPCFCRGFLVAWSGNNGNRPGKSRKVQFKVIRNMVSFHDFFPWSRTSTVTNCCCLRKCLISRELQFRCLWNCRPRLCFSTFLILIFGASFPLKYPNIHPESNIPSKKSVEGFCGENDTIKHVLDIVVISWAATMPWHTSAISVSVADAPMAGFNR